MTSGKSGEFLVKRSNLLPKPSSRSPSPTIFNAQVVCDHRSKTEKCRLEIKSALNCQLRILPSTCFLNFQRSSTRVPQGPGSLVVSVQGPGSDGRPPGTSPSATCWRQAEGSEAEGSLGGQGRLLCTPGLILTEALGGCPGSCDCQR